MEVITKYKALDGRMFDDECECLEYELNIWESLSTLEIYAEYDVRLHTWYSEYEYNQSVRVVIPDQSAVEDLKRIQQYCGFYCDIPAKPESIGTWKFNESRGQFEKVN